MVVCGGRGGGEGRGGGAVVLTSSISLSKWSPFSERLRWTQLSTLEYSLPLLGRDRLSSSMTSNCKHTHTGGPRGAG